MKEIRFHGRGGQGAVTAAYILASAAFLDGKYTQAFPKFGVERRGAPVEAFARISDKFIREKSQVYQPDYIVILDSTLLGPKESADKGILYGLKEEGTIIINTNKSAEDLGLGGYDVRSVDVSQLAIEVLGRDIVNTAMLGAFAGFTGEVSKESIHEGIKEQFKGSLAEKNITLVDKVYERAKGKG
ncbi:MAG: pyruvate ferredoxin oxidoreductase subunit gamma [Candidatus Altiarchaeota archaeon]